MLPAYVGKKSNILNLFEMHFLFLNKVCQIIQQGHS